MITLTQDEKRKLIDHLYQTKEDEKFLINVVYQDLKEIIPKEICFGAANLNKKTRQRNYDKVHLLIREYLYKHEKFVDYFDKYYPLYMDDVLYNDLILNFVFCLTQEDAKLKDVHIFKDKRSICYAKFAITDIF